MTRRLAPLALAAFAVTYLWQTFAIPLDPWSASEAANARTLPTVYGIALLLLSGYLTLRGGQQPEGDVSVSGGWRGLLGHAVSIIGFGILIPLAGLWISLAALLLVSLLVAGERRPTVLVFAPLVTVGAAWLLIGVVLDVYINPGRWLS